MRKLRNNVAFSHDIDRAMAAMGADLGDIRYKRRIAQVHAMWADIAPEAIVEHTNAVYIKKDGERRQLIVYVDESIYSAELNARRELIRLQFLQRYGEQIDEFKILISRGAYKKNRPFAKVPDPRELEDKATPVALDEEQSRMLDDALSSVEDPALRAALEKAARTDMAWRNGLKVKNDGKTEN